MSNLSARYATMPIGTPQRAPEMAHKPQMVITGSSRIEDYEELRELLPDAKIGVVLELGLVNLSIPSDREDDSIRAYAATEARRLFGGIEDQPSLWGLHPINLRRTARVDEYLFNLGTAVRERTKDIQQYADFVLIDSAVWTMPWLRRHFGIEYEGADLDAWINDRCEAFRDGFRDVSAPSIVLNGCGPGDSIALRALDDIARGYKLEGFYTSRESRRGTGMAKAKHMLEPAIKYLEQPGKEGEIGLIFGAQPLTTTPLDAYMHGASIVYRALQVQGMVTRKPVYLLGDACLDDATERFWPGGDARRVLDDVPKSARWRGVEGMETTDIICEVTGHAGKYEAFIGPFGLGGEG